MRAAHAATVRATADRLAERDHRWQPTVHGSLVNAASLVREAADHWVRSHEEGATLTQVRNRRDQAASMVGDAIKALAQAGYLMSMEAFKEAGR